MLPNSLIVGCVVCLCVIEHVVKKKERILNQCIHVDMSTRIAYAIMLLVSSSSIISKISTCIVPRAFLHILVLSCHCMLHYSNQTVRTVLLSVSVMHQLIYNIYTLMKPYFKENRLDISHNILPRVRENIFLWCLIYCTPEGEGSIYIYICYTPSRAGIMDLYHDEDSI